MSPSEQLSCGFAAVPIIRPGQEPPRQEVSPEFPPQEISWEEVHDMERPSPPQTLVSWPELSGQWRWV